MPNCIGIINIGSIASSNANIRVYIRNVTVGTSMSYETTSDGSGNVSLDVSATFFSPSHAFELWVTDASGDYQDKLPLTVDSQTTNTVCLRFNKVMDGDGLVETYAEQTILADV